MSTDAGTAFGRYRLLEPLGRGNACDVFKAKSFGVEGFEKTLVVKRLLPELARDERFVESFVVHAKLALRLSHSNVVQLVDLGRAEHHGEALPYVAAEYVPGFSLRVLLERLAQVRERLVVSACLYVGAEIVKALDHAHRRRDEQLRPLAIVHGALSPSNVLLSWDGEVKVADFCVGRAVGDASGARRTRGSSHYSSPEQLAAAALGPPSDLFSLGVLLQEILIGTASPDRRHAVNDVRRDVAPELSRLVARLLADDPASRPSSAAEVFEELLAHAYATAGRFGAAELGELMERFRESPATGAADALRAVLSQPVIATERPPPPQGPRLGAFPVVTSLRNIRDATALVLRFDASAPIVPPLRERARSVVERYGGDLVTEGPRELSAVFGLQQADGRDTENAVRCGLVLVRALAMGGLEPAVGVAAGTVAMTSAPLEDLSRELCRAAGVLSSVAPGRVAIAEDAVRNLRDLFLLELPPRDAADVAAWLVGEPRPLLEATGRFVGRKAELKSLGEYFAEAMRQKLQIIGLIGAQGVGKTRLLQEMARRLKKSAFNIGFYVTTCPPGGREEPLSAIGAILRTLCGVREWDTTDRIVEVEPRLRALGLAAEELSAVLAELGAGRSVARDSRASLGAALARMLGSLAEDRPHVLVWDDAQDMDRESLELLQTVAERLGGSRLALVFAGRPSDDAGYRRLSGYQEIRVADLDEEDAWQLVALRIGVDEVPERLLEFVHRRAGGHPMYIEELLHEAIESGAIFVLGGHVRKLDLAGALAVPRPLRALLGDRIRRLPDSERQVLSAVAVLGAPADVSLVSHMLDLSLGAVNAVAEALGREELLRRDGPVALSFPSPLLPEVLIAGLEPDAVAELHRRAARAFEEILEGQPGEERHRLARHLALAGDRERAAAAYADSGRAALTTRRFDHAATWLTRALELADLERLHAQQLGSWVAALSEAVRRVRSGRGLVELVQRLENLLLSRDDLMSRTRVELAIYAAQILGALHHYKEARRLLGRASQEASGTVELTLAACLAEAELALHQSEFRLALEQLDRAERVGSRDNLDRHRLLLARAQALGGLGEHERALDVLERARALSGHDDRAHQCERAKVRALILGFRGDWLGCAKASAEAAEHGNAAGLAYEVAFNRHNEAEALLRAGELPRAYAALQTSVSVAEEIGAARLANFNRLILAYLDALSGSDSALDELGERLSHAEAHNFTWDVLTGRYLLGKLRASRGDVAGARRELELALRMAKTTGSALLSADCTRELATLG
jgi:hypothetical protein